MQPSAKLLYADFLTIEWCTLVERYLKLVPFLVSLVETI